MVANAGTYHYSVHAYNVIKSGRVRLALVVGTTLFVGAVEDVKVVVINVVACKDIGDEFEYGGFPNTSLSNKKDGIWRLRFFFL